MTLFILPLRHIRAKWLRTSMLTAIFTLGLASMTGLYQVSTLVADNFEKQLISYGANILVTPKQEVLKIGYGGYSLGNVGLDEQPIALDAALAAIGDMPLRANIAVVAPKMLALAALSGRSVALVGVDWKAELALKGYWEAEGAFPRLDGTDEVLAGALAADRLGLVPGAGLRIHGQDMRVSGVLRPTGGDDDTVLFVPLGLAQAAAGKLGQAAFLEVAALCSGCPIEDIVAQLQSALPGTEVRALAQVAESRMHAVHFAQNLAFSVSLIILVTACAMLIMSMLSAVAERRREIGILRAVGFPRAGVFAVFVSEALGIGLLAGSAGYVLGQALALYVLGQFQLAESPALTFEPASFLAVALASALVAGLSAAFPAWRASLVEPAEALVAL
jgi:putative ABC transport system permease protein